MLQASTIMEKLSDKLKLTGEWRKDSRTMLRLYSYLDAFQIGCWFVTAVVFQYRASKAACSPLWREHLCASSIALDMFEPFLSTFVPALVLFGSYWKLRKVTRFNSEDSLPKMTIACFIHLYLSLVYLLTTISRNFWWLIAFAAFGILQDLHILLRLNLHFRLEEFPSEQNDKGRTMCGCIPSPKQSSFLWPCAWFGICLESVQRDRKRDEWQPMETQPSTTTI